MKNRNIEIYNQRANEYAQKFTKAGPRINDINYLFELSGKNNPRVLELGCANGRDIEEILKKTDNYLGVDGSEELLKIAIKKNPQVEFLLSDFNDLDFGKDGFDIVIDFASLFHLDEVEFKGIFDQIYDWLGDGGVMVTNGKYGDYKQVIMTEQNDKIQYLFNAKKIKELTGDKFEIIEEKVENLRGTDWYTIFLRKKINE